MLDRFEGTNLTNVVVDLDFTGSPCSDFSYICARVSKGPNADPDYSLIGATGTDSEVGCSEHRCAGKDEVLDL